MTILFPFGTIAGLPSIADSLRSALSTFEPFRIHLDTVGHFSTREYATVHLGTSNPGPVQALWSTIVEAMSYQGKRKAYTPHMTLGQTACNPEAIAFLTDKASKLLELHDFTWVVDSVALLQKCEDQGGNMLVYAQIPLGSPTEVMPPRSHVILEPPTYYFDGRDWSPRKPTPRAAPISSFTVATYNILHDPAFPFSPRLPNVVDAILESNADIICLQEVADQSLFLLLQDDQIRRRWPWCTRHDRSVMESERNIVVLAREDFAFKWMRVELGGKHKACVVARLWDQQDSASDKSIIVAAVHLSAGRSPAKLEMKRAEMTRLLAYLQEHHAEDDWVIVGDVNCPSGEVIISNESSILDVWEETMALGGATYDPKTNLIAAATARDSHAPERYDRVFIKKGRRLGLTPGDSTLFGLPKTGGQVASDHWGLGVTLRFGDIPADLTPGVLSTVAAPTITLPRLPVNFDDGQLTETCAENKFIPSDAQNRTFHNALDALRDLIASLSPSISSTPISSSEDASAQTPPVTAVRLVVAPVGSFAMGYHTANSDLDCVIVGNISPKTFWSLIRLKIRAASAPQRVKLRRFVKDALVQMMELDIDGVKVDLQYCPAPKLVERYVVSLWTFLGGSSSLIKRRAAGKTSPTSLEIHRSSPCLFLHSER